MNTQNCPVNITDVSYIKVNGVIICYDSPLEIATPMKNSAELQFKRYDINGKLLCDVTFNPIVSDVNYECTNYQSKQKYLQPTINVISK
jgi:hypothetical protein